MLSLLRALLWLLCLAALPAASQSLSGPDYFPLKAGKYWNYTGSSTMYGGAFSQTVTGTATMTTKSGPPMNGTPTTILNDDETGLLGDGSVTQWYFATTIDGLMLYKQDRGQDTCTPFTPPVVYLPNSMLVGQTYTVSATAECNGLSVQTDRTMQALSAKETITVPYGTFDALKIDETITMTITNMDPPGVLREHHVSWYAKDIGEVKRTWENYGSGKTLLHSAEINLADTNVNRDDLEAQKDDGDNCDCNIGDPINYGNGNHYQTETDYEGSGPYPLRFERYYNSRALVHTELGMNWRHSYSARLNFKHGPQQTTAVMVRPNGRAYVFTQNSSAWISDADVTARLTTSADSNGNISAATYITEADEIESYDATGKLLSIQARSGRKHTLAYDASGQLVTITDSAGRQIQLGYESAGRIATVTDPANLAIRYNYDDAGRLVKVERQDGRVRQYGYNETGMTQASIPHALTSITDENGALYSVWHYDDAGRTVSSEHAGGAERTTIGYQSDGSRIITDALNHSRTLTVQTVLGRAKRNTLSEACTTCADGATTSRSYDANGNVAARIDFNGNKTIYSYDLTRNLQISRVEAAGTAQARTITTEWHPTYRSPTKIAEPLRITTNTYDDKGNLLSRTVQATSDANGAQGLSAATVGTSRTWRYTYNQIGQVLTATGPRTDVDDTTGYTYDAQGNLTSISNAAGQITKLSNYDANGRVGRIVDANGLVTDLTYSLRGWLATKTVGGETTTYDYDGVGQLTKITRTDGSTVTYSYDDAHRLVAIADGLGNRIAYTLDAMANHINDQVTDPAGTVARQTARVYDALNRLQKITGGVQ